MFEGPGWKIFERVLEVIMVCSALVVIIGISSGVMQSCQTNPVKAAGDRMINLGLNPIPADNPYVESWGTELTPDGFRLWLIAKEGCWCDVSAWVSPWDGNEYSCIVGDEIQMTPMLDLPGLVYCGFASREIYGDQIGWTAILWVNPHPHSDCGCDGCAGFIMETCQMASWDPTGIP